MLYHISLPSQYSPALAKLLPSKGDEWELLSSHFKVGTKLGEGNYGQVYKGTLTVDVVTAPAKTYIAMQIQKGKSPYTVAIKLLKGAVWSHFAIYFIVSVGIPNVGKPELYLYTYSPPHSYSYTHTLLM